MLRLAAALMLTVAIQVSAQDDSVADGPWRTGYVYSVYDPHYGRPSPEVKRNQNGQGNPLTLDGKEYGKGFGCWCFSIIELDVPEGVEAVTALIGIDDEIAPASGDTYFSVWADGKRLWQSPALCREDPAISVTVPVAGLKQIKLITDSQGYGNADLADWCDVRWLREDAPARPSWDWRLQPDDCFIRPELRPFHLAYRGEDLPISVIHRGPPPPKLTYAILSEEDELVTSGEPEANPVRIPSDALADVPNGIYHLKLAALREGKTVAERTVKFGLINSRIGKPMVGSIYGVNHHEFISSYEPFAAAGIEWSRQWFCWEWIEPKKGEWRWSWHDERMAAAKEFGIKTIGVLGGIGGPAWSSPDNVTEGRRTTHGCPANMEDWEQYVRRVATRYRGQIKVWESWNEIMGSAQNNRNGWSVENYVDLHRRTWRILNEVDPENKLLVSADGLKFVQQCLDAGLGDAFDGIVPHPYRPGNRPEADCANYCVGNVGDVGSVFKAARAWLDERKRPDAEVWATEIGWALSGRGWPIVSAEIHGQYLPRAYILAQGSQLCDNLCWHDFAHHMFGICGPQGFPRPAMLSYAGLAPRLAGAKPVKRYHLDGRLHAFLFRKGEADVLTLWSETGIEFAMLKPAADVRITAFDWFGNPRPLDIPATGRAVPATGRVTYLEGTSLEQMEIERVEPLQLTPALAEVVAGHGTTLTCAIENLFGEAGEFPVRVQPPDGLEVDAPLQQLTLPRGKKGSVTIALRAPRGASPGERAVPVTVTLPGGTEAPLQAYVRVLSPLSLSIEPFDCAALGRTPIPIKTIVRNEDDRPLSGHVIVSASEGMSVTNPLAPTVAPAIGRFAHLPPGDSLTIPMTLTAHRAVTSADNLTLRAQTTDGASVEITRSLAPTVLDADGDGLADGWKINPENTGEKEQRNIAEVSIEPGHAEFFCQEIHCPRFTSGWIILHRDNQDRIVKGKRYRISFRARQRDIEGTIGVAVYNIKPWQRCGIESKLMIGSEWQRVTLDFTATRDSDNARFEFFFTETGTVWIEGMRLSEAE